MRIKNYQGSRKYYDLAHKYISSSILKAENPCKDDESFIAWRVLRRIGAVGLLWDKNSTAFLGININAETRKRILALWDFLYAWEIYTPVVKRKYGYYTLPILFGDRFVGRIETVADRKEHILRVKDIWWEPGIRQTRKLEAALERTLKNFCRFNECNEVSR